MKNSRSFEICKKAADNAPESIKWDELGEEYATTQDNTIVLNWRLLTAPLATIEYVIASQFTNADELFEDAAERKQWLNDNTLNAF
ncbi:hypothetical protein AAAC51_32910 [Priestia megaterium]